MTDYNIINVDEYYEIESTDSTLLHLTLLHITQITFVLITSTEMKLDNRIYVK